MLPLVVGGLGAIGGALGGGALAGRYMGDRRFQAMKGAAKGQRKVSDALFRAASYVPGTEMEGAGIGGLGMLARDVQKGLRGAGQNIAMMPLGNVGRVAQYAPNVACAIGGGLALSQMTQALLPQNVAINPESPYVDQNPRGIGLTTAQIGVS